jgi:hypothetical protein
MNMSFHANQLIAAIEAKMLDAEDTVLFDRLRKLSELLENLLVTV